MSRFCSGLPLHTNLFYNPSIFLISVAIISSVKCHDEVKYAPKDCEKTTTVPSGCTQDQWHTFSEDFFKECQTRLQTYDISIDDPFNLKEACLTFPDLGSDKKLCVNVEEEHRKYVNALAVSLIIIVILDIIGIGIIIYSCCFEKHPPPPPPPPAENSGAKNQPTVIVIQQIGGAAAKKDEEA